MAFVRVLRHTFLISSLLCTCVFALQNVNAGLRQVAIEKKPFCSSTGSGTLVHRRGRRDARVGSSRYSSSSLSSFRDGTLVHDGRRGRGSRCSSAGAGAGVHDSGRGQRDSSSSLSLSLSLSSSSSSSSSVVGEEEMMYNTANFNMNTGTCM